MRRFDRPLGLDNLLFAVALLVAGGFAADRFIEQEREKTVIATAHELRQSAIARATEPCLPNDGPSLQSDAQDPCAKPAPRRK
jgi:hypothetical protein